jgi:hypothetical protein
VLPPPIPSAAELEASMQALEVERLDKACQVARYYGEQPELWDQVSRGVNPYEAYKNQPRPGEYILSCMCMSHYYVIVGKNSLGHAQGFLLHRRLDRTCTGFAF